jgi:hypothetical protein
MTLFRAATVQRIGRQCRQVILAAAAGFAGLPLSEAGVQRRPDEAHLVIVLVVAICGFLVWFYRLSQRIGVKVDSLRHISAIISIG